MFIAFEGGDGTGKTTQVGMFAERLKKEGVSVLATREPTNQSPYGIEARRLLSGSEPVPPKVLQQLFVQDRTWHVKNVIIPGLGKETTVVTDRYLFSTIACGSLDLSCEELIDMNEMFPLPDVIFIFRAPIEVCLERLKTNNKKVEIFETESKMRNISDTYDKMPTLFPQARFIYIDANRDELTIAEEVFSQYTEVLGIINTYKIPW